MTMTLRLITLLAGFSLAVASEARAQTRPEGASAQPPRELQMHRYQREVEYSTLSPGGTLKKIEQFFAADSGSLAVVERRSLPGSRQIPLPVRRIAATGAHPAEPLFYLSGGPGQSNLASFGVDYFIDRHDYVTVGYRGADGPVSLDCPEVSAAIEASGDLLDLESRERVARAFESCSRRLRASGVDIDGYTVADVADDLEEARRALGYESISILAESYGTRVALVYAMKYPASIRRMILLGTNPPGHMVWSAETSDALLRRYAQLWRQDSAASRRAPDLEEVFRTVNRQMPKRWLLFPIREGTVKASVFTFLFHRETAAQAFDAYVAAANGDASGLWLISAASAYIYPDIVNWGDNASKAVSADFEPGKDYFRDLMPEGALHGAPLGSFLWAPAQTGSWPIAMMSDEYRKARPCSVQTLFLSGSLDFSTPAENVERELVPLFPNGHHVVMAEMGHVGDLWKASPAQTKKILTTFLEEGAVSQEPPRVLPMNFEVNVGFPVLAKLVVGGGALIVILAATGLAWLTRRLVRRARAR